MEIPGFIGYWDSMEIPGLFLGEYRGSWKTPDFDVVLQDE